MKIEIVCAGIILVAATLPAAAQRVPRSANEGLQVTSSFQTMLPVSSPMTLQEEAKASETARQALYEVASRECEVISKVFKGECRLMKINVNSYVQDRGNGLRGLQVSVNATYRIAPANE